MKRWRWLAAAAVGLLAVMAGSSTALADGSGQGGEGYICSGGVVSPGQYRTLTVSGVCMITHGKVDVTRDIVIRPGALLDAVSPTATVRVGRDIWVGRGAALFLGCGVSLPMCTNTSPGPDRVGGSIIAVQALGVVIHAVTVEGAISIIGGGGGPTVALVNEPGACFEVTPPAPWNSDPLFGSEPVYSDVEDTFVGADLTIVGLQTCWLGALRNQVMGNVVDVGNRMGDPDANEVLDNTVGHNLVCFANIPAVHVGDSEAPPNTVYGNALGECSPASISTVVADDGAPD